MAKGWKSIALSASAVGAVLISACAEPSDDAGGAGQGVAVVETAEDAAGGGSTTAPAAGTSGETSTNGGEGTTGTGEEPGGEGPLEAVASSIIGEPAEMSTDLAAPEDDRAVLRVNSARTTAQTAVHLAAAGNKLVVVDYEIYYTKISNLFTNAFRLNVDGEPHEPLDGINELGNFGQILNSVLVFEVPAAAGNMVLEGGLPAGTPGGLTASFELVFDPGTEQPVADAEVETGLVEDAEATSVVGDAAVIATDITDSERAILSVEAARVTGRDGDFFAHEGTKLVVVDFALSDFKAYGNIFDTAFRLQADDEWYSPLNQINETGTVGATLSTSVVFEVPRATEAFVFEAGPPARLMELDGFPDLHTENPSATWELVFP